MEHAIHNNLRPRPSVHFTAGSGWINDPHGITWDGERYHLFYQFVPDRVTWAPQCQWGHAISPDLAHWRELSPALVPEEHETGCWSGSCVIADGRPTIAYTSVVEPDLDQGRVALAYRDEDTQRWTTTPSDIVIPGPPTDAGVRVFRDPCVWPSDDGWMMLMGAGLSDGRGAALQYRSPDLRTWSYEGVLCASGGTAGTGSVGAGSVWECPQLVMVDDAWVLLVSLVAAGELHHVAASVGQYDGTRYVPETWQRLTYGQSAYAMTAFNDNAGRRCVMSWLREDPRHDRPGSGWSGAHSVPALIGVVDGFVVLTPHPDILALSRPLPSAMTGDRLTATTDAALSITFDPASVSSIIVADPLGVRLRLTVSADDGAVRVHDDAGLVDEMPCRSGTQTCVLLDADILEVFGPAGYGAFRIRPASGLGGCRVEISGPAPGSAKLCEVTG